MSLVSGALYVAPPYFLLAPEYYRPDPGIEVDRRSIFFFGAH